MDKLSDKKKKVLFLITKSNWGGAQRYVYDLATNLDRTRFEPVVALGGNGQLSELLTHANIRTITLNSLQRDISVKQDHRLVRELWHLLKFEKPDIFHVNSSKAGGLGALIGRLRRVPRIIFTAHGWAFNEDRPAWQRFFIKLLHWLTVLLSHRTIAVSKGMQRQLTWLGAQRKMKVIHPGRTIGVMYNRTEARTKLYQTASSLDPSRRRVWIGTIAELHPIKNLQVFIAAAALLHTEHPELQFVIIGEGELHDRLTAQIATNNLKGTVVMTGAIPEAARLLHAFDYFTLPSQSEAYGYVIHEAGLAALPVVATNVGGIPDIITHQQSGLLVPPGDAPALATALRTLYTDPELAERLRLEHHRRMQDRSVERMVRATEALYTL